jgi:hypothetical protein
MLQAFREHFLQLVVGDAMVALTGAHSRLLRRASESMNGGTVDGRNVLLLAGRGAELKRGDYARAVFAITLTNTDTVRLGKLVTERRIRKKMSG